MRDLLSTPAPELSETVNVGLVTVSMPWKVGHCCAASLHIDEEWVAVDILLKYPVPRSATYVHQVSCDFQFKASIGNRESGRFTFGIANQPACSKLRGYLQFFNRKSAIRAELLCS
nr:polycomb group protein FERTILIZATION-INDEPENDENT ENDOSPERM [Ipomoea batatas]